MSIKITEKYDNGELMPLTNIRRELTESMESKISPLITSQV